MAFATQILVVFVILLGLIQSDVPHRNDTLIGKTVQIYNINIDDSPEVRWKPIINDFQAPITEFFNQATADTPTWLTKLIQFYIKTVRNSEFVKEIKAIAKLVGLPLGKVLLLNLMYELHDYKSCTSIIARTKSGEILLGRNLDYDFAESLSGLTIQINYLKNGKPQFTVNTIAGSVLVVSGVRHGQYAISQDQRLSGTKSQNIKQLIFRRAVPALFLTFQVLRDEQNFDRALERLSNQRIAAASYYILSGIKNNQGIVIERNRNSIHQFYTLTDEQWYLVQTNYDRDQPDNPNDYRRIPAEQRMEKIGRDNISLENMYSEVFKQYPNMNAQTLLTTLMNPSQNYFNTTIWY